MAKVKFTWWFRLSNDKTELEIFLNDNVNSIIEIAHENFNMHLANKLHEILIHEHEVGTKTDVRGLGHVERAKEMHNASKVK